jgi:hypothetical protein
LINVPAIVRLLLFIVNVVPSSRVKLFVKEFAVMIGNVTTPVGITTLVVLMGTPPHQFVEVFQSDVAPTQVPVERTLIGVEVVEDGPLQPLAYTLKVAVPSNAGSQVTLPEASTELPAPEMLHT